MASTRINFTKSTISSLTPPIKQVNKKGGVFDTYYDTKEPGLVLLVSNGGAKTFYLYTKINGKPERIKLGRFPDLSVDNARKRAKKRKGQITDGKNPNEEKKKIREEATFGELFKTYLERHAKLHKRSWTLDEEIYNRHLIVWSNKKLSTIRRDDVEKLHSDIGENSGIYAANRTVSLIRAIFNKAIAWGFEGENPVKVKMFRESSRDRFLQPSELPGFFEALDAESNETAKDAITLMLLTGARKNNVLTMRWEQINFDRKEWRIPHTKNSEPLTIPLSVQAVELIEARNIKRKNDKELKASPWVFPSDVDYAKNFRDPKKAWKRILLRAEAYQLIELIAEAEKWSKDKVTKEKMEMEVSLTAAVKQYRADAKKLKLTIDSINLCDLHMHDLRRSLGSWQAVTGASGYIIGKSLGHKSQQATAIYARLNLDPVRASVERATEAIMAAAKPRNTI